MIRGLRPRLWDRAAARESCECCEFRESCDCRALDEGLGQRNLNSLLRIFRALIRYSRVEAGI